MSKIVIITLILAILVICSPFILNFFERIHIYTFRLGWLRGEETKEKLIEKYIEGLKTGNNQIIEKLVPKSHETTKAIQEKIEKFSKANFDNIEIYYGGKPQPLEIDIKNIRLKNEEVVSDEIWIEKDCHQYPGILECKKWYLITGTIKEKYQPIPPVIKLERD
ncbi:hypothetical protein KKA09_02950 [Patescibacteria group bacterium]|nr:hypothetical protein [Patescibacteria group bacterium]